VGPRPNEGLAGGPQKRVLVRKGEASLITQGLVKRCKIERGGGGCFPPLVAFSAVVKGRSGVYRGKGGKGWMQERLSRDQEVIGEPLPLEMM